MSDEPGPDPAPAAWAVRDPRGTRPATDLFPLAPRPATLAGLRVWLIRSWAEGSGLEPWLDTIEATLRRRFPGVQVRQLAKPSAYSIDDPALWDAVHTGADAFVYAAAPSASTTHYALHYGAGLERRGRPGVVLTYETLDDDARHSVAHGSVAMRWVAAPYPLADHLGRLDHLSGKVIDALTTPAQTDAERLGGRRAAQVPPRLAFSADFESLQQQFAERGWSDGLPVVPPTEAAVERMLAGSTRPRDEVVTAAMGPEGLTVTVEQVAINAVMAGCTPPMLPVLLAAVQAFAQGLPGNPAAFSTPARATNSFAFMQVVNGPIRQQAGFNGGLNALGPGNRANAALGRALRLAILNLGGGVVGRNLLPVQGNPAAYGFAFAENEEASPWPSLAVSRGFGPDDSVLTLFTGGWSHVGNYIEAGLDRLAQDVASFEYPNGLALLLSPPRARLLAAEGAGKADVEQRVWQQATRRAGELRGDVYWHTLIEPNLRLPPERRLWSPELLTAAEGERLPAYPRRQVVAIVVGGDISPMMQAWKMHSALSVSIDRWR